MNHAKKKSGVSDKVSGTPLRSVCGILCGQRKSAKSYSAQKLQKAKENTRNPRDFRCNSGAAGRIRTADLILTNYILSCCGLLFRSWLSVRKPSNTSTFKVFFAVTCCSLILLRLNTFSLHLNTLLNTFKKSDATAPLFSFIHSVPLMHL